ncbi:penicillin-insensitive murein endopeptidase [Elusimicrobiota bacterium]
MSKILLALLVISATGLHADTLKEAEGDHMRAGSTFTGAVSGKLGLKDKALKLFGFDEEENEKFWKDHLNSSKWDDEFYIFNYEEHILFSRYQDYMFKYLGHPSEAKRGYNEGWLKNAAELPMEGRGYVKVLRGRQRQYGTAETIRTIEIMGLMYAEKFPDAARLQIADIVRKKGGETGHISHENGLDVDVLMVSKTEVEQDPYTDPEDGDGWKNGFDEDFVTRNNRVLKSFDIEKNWEIIKLAAFHAPVERIFVDKAVKRLFCKVYGQIPQNQYVLHFLVPWRSHDDHFHIRFECDPNDKDCSRTDDVARQDRCYKVGVDTPMVKKPWDGSKRILSKPKNPAPILTQ